MAYGGGPGAADVPDSIVRLNGTQPTEEAYTDILLAFAWFNERLFEGRLPAPLITFARKARMLGAFCPHRFESRSGGSAHEIILNPFYLAYRDDYESLSTLVHEMVHAWREDLAPDAESRSGRRSGYHDEVWAQHMEQLGLIPSDTGEPGGKRTGTRVSHYAVAGGAFDVAAKALLSRGFVIRWSDRRLAEKTRTRHDAAAAPSRAQDRIKFTCAGCGLNAWAKPSAALKCGPCDQSLTPHVKKESTA